MAVIDYDGTKLNSIIVDERAVGHYNPGYGTFLIDEGPVHNPPKPNDESLVNFDKDFVGLELLQVEIDGKPLGPMDIGDKLDLRTLNIIKKVLHLEGDV